MSHKITKLKHGFKLFEITSDEPSELDKAIKEIAAKFLFSSSQCEVFEKNLERFAAAIIAEAKK